MISDDTYIKRINALEGLIGFHPDWLEKHEHVTEAQKQALALYYFAGREINVDSVFEYRRKLLEKDPGLDQVADEAWQALGL